MAGRGRGQPFQAISDGLGIGRGQINQQHVDPPPIYPPLGKESCTTFCFAFFDNLISMYFRGFR